MQQASHQIRNSEVETSDFVTLMINSLFRSARPAAFESVTQRPYCNRSGGGIQPESTSGRAFQPARVQPRLHPGQARTESESRICGIARRDTTWCQLWTHCELRIRYPFPVC